jgi:glycosyltransferase involved in cell wall biosynthesis
MKLSRKREDRDIKSNFYIGIIKIDSVIAELNIADRLILRTDFIQDSDVRYYLSAADFVIQPYRNATQSGVTPLAYHFEKPMLVTNVGGLPSLVPDGKVGLVAEPNPKSIANKIEELYAIGEDYFLPYLQSEKKKYSWKVLADTIIRLSGINI